MKRKVSESGTQRCREPENEEMECSTVEWKDFVYSHSHEGKSVEVLRGFFYHLFDFLPFLGMSESDVRFQKKKEHEKSFIESLFSWWRGHVSFYTCVLCLYPVWYWSTFFSHSSTYSLYFIPQAVLKNGVISGSGFMNSGNVRCGNSVCRPFSGLFVKNPLPNGYIHVTTIPAGASNVTITELRNSINFLGESGDPQERWCVCIGWKMHARDSFGSVKPQNFLVWSLTPAAAAGPSEKKTFTLTQIRMPLTGMLKCISLQTANESDSMTTVNSNSNQINVALNRKMENCSCCRCWCMKVEFVCGREKSTEFIDFCSYWAQLEGSSVGSTSSTCCMLYVVCMWQAEHAVKTWKFAEQIVIGKTFQPHILLIELIPRCAALFAVCVCKSAVRCCRSCDKTEDTILADIVMNSRESFKCPIKIVPFNAAAGMCFKRDT